MSAAERARAKKADLPTEATETRSIVFEWPLYGLKQMFDNSKADSKSKVVKSASFDGGRWTVLFYAQSGHEQFCSLYLNAEPLDSERVHPLIAGAQQASDASRDAGTKSSGKSPAEGEEKWSRQGLFRFTFDIQPLDRSQKLGTKEAHDHAFSHKTSNWGWAQFAKRDTVFYGQPHVKAQDAFLISVTITANAERPRPRAPVVHAVPPVLISAYGSLLDDPEHSDVVFHLARRGRRPPKKIYAIKKILALRSEYFRDMFEGGFLEAERAEDSSSDEMDRGDSPPPHDDVPAHTSGTHEVAMRAARGARRAGEASEEDKDDYMRGPEALLEDSDEDLDEESFDENVLWAEAHSPLQSQDSAARGSSPPQRHSSVAAADAVSGQQGDASEVEDMDDDYPVEDDILAIAGGTPAASRTPDVVAGPSRSASGIFVEAPSEPAAGGADDSSSMAIDQPPLRTSLASNNAAPRPLSATGSLIAAEAAAQSPKAAGTSTSGRRSLTAPTPYSRTAPSGPKREHAAKAQQSADRRKRRRVTAPSPPRRFKQVVRDSSYATFKALLFFLYTETIEFAPLTSSFLSPDMGDDVTMDSPFGPGTRDRSNSSDFLDEMVRAHKKRQAVIDAYCAENPDKPSPCSAKAMYKLADKLQIDDLKRRAREHLANSLTVQNIVWEAFSGFNSQYPEIMQMEIEFLLKHWSSVKKSSTMKSIFARQTAHPGLAYIWPLVLEHLDYRRVPEEEEVFVEEKVLPA